MKRFIICILFFVVWYSGITKDYYETQYKMNVAFIMQLLDNYKAAYAKKDIDYIKAFLSNDAIIITETNNIDRYDTGKNSNALFQIRNKNEYKRIVENKEQYLKRLNKVFNDNIALNLSIANVKIYPHKDYDDIYGVSFLQYWKAKDNSSLLLEDDCPGYIFMMVDFKNGKNTPILHVRTWQPENHIKQDNDIYHLYDFVIL